MMQDGKIEIAMLTRQYTCGEIDRTTFFEQILLFESSFVLPIENLDIISRLREYGIDSGLDTVFPKTVNRAIDEIDHGSKYSLLYLVANSHYYALSDLINEKIAGLYSMSFADESAKQVFLADHIMLYMEALRKGFRRSVSISKYVHTLQSMKRHEDILACYDDAVVSCIKNYKPDTNTPFLAYFHDRYLFNLISLKEKVFSEGKPLLSVNEGSDISVYEKVGTNAPVIGTLPAGSIRRVYSIRNDAGSKDQFYQIKLTNNQPGFVLVDDNRILFQDENVAAKQLVLNPPNSSGTAADSQETIMLAIYCTAFRKQNKPTNKPGILSKQCLEQQFSAEIVLDIIHSADFLSRQILSHEEIIMNTIDLNWLNYLLSAPCSSFRDISLTTRHTGSHFAEIAMQNFLENTQETETLPAELRSYEYYDRLHHNDDSEVKILWCEIAVRLPYLRNQLKIDHSFHSIKSRISNTLDVYKTFLGDSLQLGTENLKQKTEILIKERGVPER